MPETSGAARLVAKPDPIARHVIAAGCETDFNAGLRKPAEFGLRPDFRRGRRDHLRRDHSHVLPVRVVEKGADQARLAHRCAFFDGGFEQRCPPRNALRSAPGEKIIGRSRLRVDAIDARQRFRSERVETGRRFGRRKAEVDGRRWIGGQRDQQRWLALVEDVFMRQSPDPFRDPIVEQRNLFDRRVFGLGLDRQRIERFKPE